MDSLDLAIKTIREECKKHINCSACRLRTENNKCYIKNYSPEHYKMVSELPTDERIFY